MIEPHAHNSTDSPRVKFSDLDHPGFDSRARFYLSADTTLTIGAPRKIELNSPNYDSRGEITITSATNAFYANNDGFYQVTGKIGFTANAIGDQNQGRIHVNGSVVASRFETASVAAANHESLIADTLKLNAGDKVELYIDSAGGGNYTAKSGSNLTYMAIHRIS